MTSTVATRGMWRYFDRLPVHDRASIVSLGEGDTPLIDLSATLGARLGVGGLHLKAEDRNPTGSFKARIASVAASLVRERGLLGMVGTSSGNGGAAASAYAAASGSRAVLFTLADIVPMKLLEIAVPGGVAYRVDGVGHDAASTRQVARRIADAARDEHYYPMLTGFSFAPEAMMGVQTIAWELAEERPEITAVYAPVGGGGLLTGIHRGYESDSVGVPRIVGVHPAGATALPLALDGVDEGMPGPVETSISGLQMAVLYDPDGASRAVRESRGHATAVTDREVWAAQRTLAREHGLLVEPAGAAALAGLMVDVRDGRVGPDDHVAVIVTGAGYKDAPSLSRLDPSSEVPVISADAVGAVLASIAGGHRG